MDDVVWNIFDTSGIAQIIAYGVSSIFLVYDVTFGNQRGDPWLLFIGNRRLGLGQSQMEH